MDKFRSSKGKSFGQCTIIDYDVPYMCFSAIMKSGIHNGIVGRLVIIKVHVSQCSKEGKFLFNIVGEFNLSYKSMNRKTGRAFIKFNNFLRNRIRFYNTFIYELNYEELTKNECRNYFETVELWHKALISFDKKVQ